MTLRYHRGTFQGMSNVTQQIKFRVDEDLETQVKELATVANRPVSWVCREIIKVALRNGGDRWREILGAPKKKG